MPDRNDAWELLCEYTKGDSLRKHAIAVETAMRACAKRYGEADADEDEDASDTADDEADDAVSDDAVFAAEDALWTEDDEAALEPEVPPTDELEDGAPPAELVPEDGVIAEEAPAAPVEDAAPADEDDDELEFPLEWQAVTHKPSVNTAREPRVCITPR